MVYEPLLKAGSLDNAIRELLFGLVGSAIMGYEPLSCSTNIVSVWYDFFEAFFFFKFSLLYFGAFLIKQLFHSPLLNMR